MVSLPAIFRPYKLIGFCGILDPFLDKFWTSGHILRDYDRFSWEKIIGTIKIIVVPV